MTCYESKITTATATGLAVAPFTAFVAAGYLVTGGAFFGFLFLFAEPGILVPPAGISNAVTVMVNRFFCRQPTMAAIGKPADGYHGWRALEQ